MKIRDKKGNILIENIIFLTLNLLFIVILLFFVFAKTGSAAVLEEKYAKEIALVIDCAEPVMTIQVNMVDALAKTEKGYSYSEIVKIDNNIVTVQLREKGGYSYSFFNDVIASANFNTTSNEDYYFIIN